MAPPMAYVTKEALNGSLGLEGMASSLIVVTSKNDAVTVDQVTRSVERQFSSIGFEIANSMRLADYRQVIEDHLLILASFLMLMSILVLLVGGLGLASTMSINVFERTREIGVLRAIGASTKDILKIIVAEGVLIGMLSWVFALLISWPVSSLRRLSSQRIPAYNRLAACHR